MNSSNIVTIHLLSPRRGERIEVRGVRNPEHGFILIASLAVLSILAVLSMEYSHLARNAAERVRAAGDELAGFYAAESGVERAKALIGADTGNLDSVGESWRDTSAYSKELSGWRIAVRVTDEESKINLNTADAAVLSKLFEQFGMNRQDRDVFVGSLLDWIDADDFHRTNGAEDDYYKSNGFLYGAKNAPLDSLEEISRIRGVPADLMTRSAKFGDATCLFSECVTVTGDTRVNINTAPAPVLVAIGFSTDEVRALLKSRAKSPWSAISGISPVVGTARFESLRPLLRVSSASFFVESTAEREGSTPVSVFSILRRSPRRIYTAGFW